MDIRQFDAFLTVAEELHFGRAAERLHLTQPALSRLIRSMEKDLGTQLFERTTRRVSLTQSGQALLKPARTIQEQMQGIHRVARSAQDGEIGTIRVGFAGFTGYALVSQLARHVTTSHPGITLDLHPRNYSGEATQLVQEGEIDLAVLSLPAPPGVETLPMIDETLMVAVPDHDRLAQRDAVTVAELAHRHFVSYPASHGSRVRDAMISLCTAAGFVPTIAQEAPDPYSLLTLVGAGVGLSMVVSSATNTRIAGVKYLEITGSNITLPIAIGWRHSNPSVALSRVIDVARDYAASRTAASIPNP